MSKRYPRAKWVLPGDIHPVGTRCFQIVVPDDPYYIAAFRGALLNLASASQWQDDPEHKAREVAAVWRPLIDGVTDCGAGSMFDVRQNGALPCKLEKTADGVIWVQFANLRLCAPYLRLSGQTVQWSADGITWVDGPGQSGGDERTTGTYDPPWPVGTVPPGQTAQCLSAENILSVYSTALTQMRAEIALMKPPTAVAAVGTGILSIFMPVAIIGTIMLVLCGILEELGTAGIDDMLTTATLDKLRCNLKNHAGADGSFTADAYNAFYAQLSVDFTGLKLSALQYYFDMLGSVGLSRQGKADNIQSAICDCGWCYEWDFTTGNSDWVSDTGWAQYTPGVGWESVTIGGVGNVTYVKLNFAADCALTYFYAEWTPTGANGSNYPLLRGWTGPDETGTLQFSQNYTDVNGMLNTGFMDTPNTVRCILFSRTGPQGASNFVLTKIRIHGTGVNPFGADNC